MMIPTTAVHRAALAIQDRGDISQCDFEDHYHCRFGLSPDIVNYYYVEFDSEKDATAFMLRWM